MHSSSPRFLAAFVLASLVSPASAETLHGVPVEVLARATVKLSDRSVTYIRIRPPAIPVRQVPPTASVAAEPTAEEKLAELRLAAKARIQLTVGATVYPGVPTVTELSWTREDGRRFRAFSSVDFNHLTQLSELETESIVYGWFPFVSAGDPAELPAGVRESLAAHETEPHYLFEGSEADAEANADTLRALDYLHAYFELHRAELVAATARRAADAAEHERQAALKEARPKNETIYFWKIDQPIPR